MYNYFNDGFTELSYFNVCKNIVCNFYKQRMNDENLKFYFSEDEEVNACATIDKSDNDILIINAGTIVKVFSLMKLAFCQKSILGDIGNSLVEDDNFVYGAFDKYKRQVIFTGTPKDEVREKISNYCSFNYILKFVALHEIGHIVDGHTRLLNTVYMNPEIHMRLESFVNNKRYCLDRRTFEMDADSVAISAIFDNVATTYQNHDNILPINILPKPEDIFKIWAFSIATLFMYFEAEGTTTYDSFSYYLPNEARFKLAMLAAYENARIFIKHGVNTKLKSNTKIIIHSVLEGVDEASHLIEKIYGKKYSWSTHLIDEEFDIYSQEVLDNWNNRLRIKLKEFAKAPLYNPATVDDQFTKAMKKE